jgi:hypothetical protein
LALKFVLPLFRETACLNLAVPDFKFGRASVVHRDDSSADGPPLAGNVVPSPSTARRSLIRGRQAVSLLWIYSQGSPSSIHAKDFGSTKGPAGSFLTSPTAFLNEAW